jgi:hypothetical protein
LAFNKRERLVVIVNSMLGRAHPTPGQAAITCASATVTALLCGGLMVAAALGRAPSALLVIIVVACTLVPMLVAWDAAPAVAALHNWRTARRTVVAQLRQELDALPETPHPLGL